MPVFKNLALAAVLAGAASVAVFAQAMEPGGKRVRITYQNLTTGQAFAPAIFMSHDDRAPKLYALGSKASFGIVELAETGNVGPIADMAGKMKGGSVGMSAIGLPTMPGSTGTVDVEVSRAHPMISGAWMLGMTNDGFTGVSGVDAFDLDQPRTIDVMAMDAGSEKNNERRPYLIAMMGVERDPENDVITRHRGIRGDADAPAAWKFDPSKPVARVTFTPL